MKTEGLRCVGMMMRRGLASKLGLSKSTVAEQLVKAESEIVGGFLDSSR